MLTCFAIAAIRFYQVGISPFLPASCRFYPTCSAFALEALRRHGFIKGCLLTFHRLLRCHPWHPGGIDPVPERFHWTEVFHGR